MVTIYITSTEAIARHSSHIKQLRRVEDGDVSMASRTALGRHAPDEDALEHPHSRQVIDLQAWHIGVENARWYVKPRSTCWFEEYLFNIYTLDMFYDILRMRRRTFNRLAKICDHSYRGSKRIGGSLLVLRKRL